MQAKLKVVSFHKIDTKRRDKPILYGWREGSRSMSKCLHSESCGDHAGDIIRAEVNYRTAVLASTVQATPVMIYERVVQQVVRRHGPQMGKAVRQWIPDRKSITDKVTKIRTVGRERISKQPTNYEEFAADLKRSFMITDDEELFLQSHGEIEPGKGEAGGYYAFYMSDHGAMRLRTSHSGIWISDGTHRFALGFWTQLYCLASRTTAGRSQYSCLCFTSRKNAQFYRLFWNMVRDKVGANYVPKVLLTDLERAARTTFRDIYKVGPEQAKLLLCFFHFSVTLRRKAGELHLLDRIGTTSTTVFGEIYGLARHLPFVPLEHVQIFWHHLLDKLRSKNPGKFDEPINAFVTYFEGQFIGRCITMGNDGDGALFDDPF